MNVNVNDLYSVFFLEEMCEDLGIKVEDADEYLKQAAREMTESWIKDNR